MTLPFHRGGSHERSRRRYKPTPPARRSPSTSSTASKMHGSRCASTPPPPQSRPTAPTTNADHPILISVHRIASCGPFRSPRRHRWLQNQREDCPCRPSQSPRPSSTASKPNGARCAKALPKPQNLPLPRHANSRASTLSLRGAERKLRAGWSFPLEGDSPIRYAQLPLYASNPRVKRCVSLPLRESSMKSLSVVLLSVALLVSGCTRTALVRLETGPDARLEVRHYFPLLRQSRT